jgi:hypothetical protein
METGKLLVTFCKKQELEKTLEKVYDIYTLVQNRIYVLQVIDEQGDIAITYNCSKEADPMHVRNTLLIHRYKRSNTLYTINALNLLPKDQQNKVNFFDYTNSILMSRYAKLVIRKTKLMEVIEV